MKIESLDRNWVFDMIYPVNSIYMSMTNTNPSTLFGGTWVQLKDRFLLGVGDTYTEANKTGGEAMVTLTTSQIPSHTHGLNNHRHTYSKSATTSGSTTLTIAQMPSHKHTVKAIGRTAAMAPQDLSIVIDGSRTDANVTNNTVATGGGQGHSHSITLTSTNSGNASGNTASAGSGSSHNNMPPYLTVYMWKRTA